MANYWIDFLEMADALLQCKIKYTSFISVYLILIYLIQLHMLAATCICTCVNITLLVGNMHLPSSNLRHNNKIHFRI